MEVVVVCGGEGRGGYTGLQIDGDFDVMQLLLLDGAEVKVLAGGQGGQHGRVECIHHYLQYDTSVRKCGAMNRWVKAEVEGREGKACGTVLLLCLIHSL